MSEGMNISGQNRDPAMERLLGGLRPTRPSLGRDGLMFRAGQQSVQRRLRSYQAATAALLVALVATVGFPLVSHSGPGRQTQNGVFVQSGMQASDPLASGSAELRRDKLRSGLVGYAPDEPPGEGSLAMLRKAVLTGGADALPTPNYLPARDVKMTRWGALAG